MKLYVYPDYEIYESPPEWKSDDYIVVTEQITCKELLEHFGSHWQEIFNELRRRFYGEDN